MSEERDLKPKGPFTVWKYHSYEGWSWEDYQTLKEAVEAEKYGSPWVVTRGPIDYTVEESTP